MVTVLAALRGMATAALAGTGTLAALPRVRLAQSAGTADTGLGTESEIGYLGAADSAAGADGQQAPAAAVSALDSSSAAEGSGGFGSQALSGTGVLEGRGAATAAPGHASLSGTGSLAATFPQGVPVSALDSASALEAIPGGIGLFTAILGQHGPGGYVRLRAPSHHVSDRDECAATDSEEPSSLHLVMVGVTSGPAASVSVSVSTVPRTAGALR